MPRLGGVPSLLVLKRILEGDWENGRMTSCDLVIRESYVISMFLQGATTHK